MKKQYFYIILACFVVAAFGFTLGAQSRVQTITEQTCPNDNCETIIKEYEYLPIPELSKDNEELPADAEHVDYIAGITGEDAETDVNAIYDHNVFVAGLNATAQQLDVNGGLFIAGSKVKATTKQQTLFAAGEAVYVDSETTQDAYVAGMEVEFGKNSSVRDLFTAGQTVKISGVVTGSVFAAGENIIIENATILGDANFEAATLEFKGDNLIHGTLRYDGDTRVISLDQSKVGGIASYAIPKVTEDTAYNIYTFAASVCTIIPTVALFSVFIIAISKKQYDKLTTNKSGVKDCGIGLLALFIAPCVIVLMLMFEILALINIFLILALVIAFLLAVPVATVRLGKLINNGILKAKNANHYQIVLLGAITFGLLWVTPIIGGVIDFALLIAGFGYVIGELIHASIFKNKAQKALKTE